MNNYCIYTDKICTEAQISREHIFPLSLGGVDGFEIPAERDFNNKVGSTIDGKLANDFLIMLDRKRTDARGHSNKKVEPVWKKSKLSKTNAPLQIKITDKGMQFFDPISRTVLDRSTISGKEIQTTHTIDFFIRLKFTAKTALSAGYYIYGNLFRKYVDTKSLREFMCMTNNNMRDVIERSKLKATDQFTYKGKDEADVLMFKEMAKYLKGSSVFFVHSTENLLISVSVMGTYLGTLNVPANTDYFSHEGDFRLGHVVYIDESKKIKRKSFHSVVGELGQSLGIIELESSS